MSAMNVSPNPPTHPGELEELKGPPAWPKVIGWISAVWGGLSGCCMLFGGVMAIGGAAMIPADQRNQFPPQFITPPMMVLMVVGVVSSILLLVAGIFTINRKITGRYLHLTYAILSLALFPVGIYLGLQNQAEMESWIRQNPDTQFAKQQAAGGAVGQIFGYAMQGIGLLHILFLIVWFGVIKKTAASMGASRPDDDLLDEEPA
jgi:predicted tellurium resistance membrane protein TerC